MNKQVARIEDKFLLPSSRSTLMCVGEREELLSVCQEGGEKVSSRRGSVVNESDEEP